MIYYQINTRKQNTFIKWSVCHGILWSAYPKSPPPDGDKVNFEHGIELDKKLDEKDIDTMPLYNGLLPNNTLNINGLSIILLTPPKYVIEKLIEEWTTHELYQAYLKESKGSDKVGKPSDDLISYQDVINNRESVHKWDKDLINSSSMSFIISYAGCNILLFMI